LRAKDASPWWPKRNEAYLGVLVDDLTTRGVTEPYRMFTSRAEYRLQLREDNADARLTPIGRELGLVSDARWETFNTKLEDVARERQRLSSWLVRPRSAEALALTSVLAKPLEREYTALDLLRRPEMTHAAMMQAITESNINSDLVPQGVSTEVAEQVEIAVKYEGYIARQEEEVERERRFEDAQIPAHFDYALVKGLSREVEQKLSKLRPATLGQAGRISGITPAAIALLLVHLRRGGASSASGGVSTQGVCAA
jgi:tRNA uridine 5-carboxymethylaminomethyl modification enzyme